MATADDRNDYLPPYSAHVRSWILANPGAAVGPSGDWELPRESTENTRAALMACIGEADVDAPDADATTAEIADAILARFDVRPKR